jgi:hypothetical protein
VESAANAAKKAEAAAKKKLTEAASSVKTTDKVLRAQIETILKDYGIDRGAWHGGDLVGNHCRLLMAEAKDIFTCIEKVLTERGAAIGMSEEAINSIKLRCEVKRDLLQQYDGFFARLSLPQKDVTPTTIEEAQRFITNANILVHQLQMSVTPKGHVALVHALEQMMVMRGVSHGREDRVEVWHQFGKAADVRTRNRRKSAQRFLQMSLWEQMNRNPLVAKHKETIKDEFALSESTLLKRKANWDTNQKSKKRQTHDERETIRATSLQEFTPPNLIPTAKEDNEKYSGQESNM